MSSIIRHKTYLQQNAPWIVSCTSSLPLFWVNSKEHTEVFYKSHFNLFSQQCSPWACTLTRQQKQQQAKYCPYRRRSVRNAVRNVATKSRMKFAARPSIVRVSRTGCSITIARCVATTASRRETVRTARMHFEMQATQINSFLCTILSCRLSCRGGSEEMPALNGARRWHARNMERTIAFFFFL